MRRIGEVVRSVGEERGWCILQSEKGDAKAKRLAQKTNSFTVVGWRGEHTECA